MDRCGSARNTHERKLPFFVMEKQCPGNQADPSGEGDICTLVGEECDVPSIQEPCPFAEHAACVLDARSGSEYPWGAPRLLMLHRYHTGSMNSTQQCLPCSPLPNGAADCLFFGQSEVSKQTREFSVTNENQTSFLRSVELARCLHWTKRGCKVNPGTSNRINP